METVLDQLIENAEKLNDLSKRVIAEEELSPLQNRQQELLTTLVSLDDSYHKVRSNKDDQSPAHHRIQKKLDIFERLNASFVNNIVSSHGLIQFGMKSSKVKKK